MTEEEQRKRQREQEIIGEFIEFANLIVSVTECLNLLLEYGYPLEDLQLERKYIHEHGNISLAGLRHYEEDL